MNRTMRQSVWGPLAGFGRQVAAIVAECNYAQARMTALRNAPLRS